MRSEVHAIDETQPNTAKAHCDGQCDGCHVEYHLVIGFTGAGMTIARIGGGVVSAGQQVIIAR
jgi:hypothetical protein